MNFQTTETIQRLWETFLQEQMQNLPPEQREGLGTQFEAKLGQLLQKAGGDSDGAFFDLIGLGPQGPGGFDKVGYPHISPDFDDDPRAAYFRQMEYGLYVRMALLAMVLGTA